MCAGLGGVAYFARQADPAPGTLLVDGEIGVEVEAKPLRPGSNPQDSHNCTGHCFFTSDTFTQCSFHADLFETRYRQIILKFYWFLSM
jgi:hypothetical protein